MPVLDLGRRPIPPYVPAALRQLSATVMAQLSDTQEAARNYELYTALGLELDDMPGTLEEAEAALRTRDSMSRLFDQRRATAVRSGVKPAEDLLSEEGRRKAEQVARFVNRLRPAKRKAAPTLGMVGTIGIHAAASHSTCTHALCLPALARLQSSSSSSATAVLEALAGGAAGDARRSPGRQPC